MNTNIFRIVLSVMVFMLALTTFIAPAEATRIIVTATTDESGWMRTSPAMRSLWEGAGFTVYKSELLSSDDAGNPWAVVDTLLDHDAVTTAGLFLSDGPDWVTYYSGLVLVSFDSDLIREPDPDWGGDQGLILLDTEHPNYGNTYRYFAPIEPSELMALRRLEGTNGVISVTPLVYTMRDPDAFTPAVDGGYHRLPEGRNSLAIRDEMDVEDSPLVSFIETTLDGTLSPSGIEDYLVVRFRTEDELNSGWTTLNTRPDTEVPGALLSTTPLAFLTDQLVVRYKNASGHADNGGLRLALGMETLRKLPYVDNGYLYRHTLPGYQVYDAIQDLLQSQLVLYAIPNIVTANRSACGTGSCTYESHQDYLQMMNACEATSFLSKWDKRPIIGILDDGVSQITNLACERLHVGTAIDFDTMQACTPSATDQWCESTECQTVTSEWNDSHGEAMALIAAADEDDTSLRGVAPGTEIINAKRVPTESVSGLATYWSDIGFSDGLWWIAGGDPKWCRDDTNYPCNLVTGSIASSDCDAAMSAGGAAECGSTPTVPSVCEEDYLPCALDSVRAADIINMSFSRPNFVVDGCSGSLCASICIDSTACSFIDEALQHLWEGADPDGLIREDGVILVNAVGDSGSDGSGSSYVNFCESDADTGGYTVEADLAASDYTIAAGSVTTAGKPFTGSSNCFIQWPGIFIDVVAPMGGEPGSGAVTKVCDDCEFTAGTTTGADVEEGASSAASAAVSGVAALMLRVNPDLTAPQARCILRETANKFRGTGEIWEDLNSDPFGVSGCEFSPIIGRSDCMGFGMVDACAATQEALDCVDGGWRLPWTKTHIDHGFIGSGSGPGMVGDLKKAIQSDCVCDENGGTFLLDTTLGKLLINMELRVEVIVGKKIGGAAAQLLDCLASGKCFCATGYEDCLSLEIVNISSLIYYEVRFEACLDGVCHDLDLPTPVWKPGDAVKIPLRIDPIMTYWETGGGLPLIKAYSQGLLIPSMDPN